MHLSPSMMLRALYANNTDLAARFGLMDCIECGCCSYICPSNLRLVQRFRVGKATEREEKKRRLDAARAHEAEEQRIAEQEAKKHG